MSSRNKVRLHLCKIANAYEQVMRKADDDTITLFRPRVDVLIQETLEHDRVLEEFVHLARKGNVYQKG